MDFARRQLEKYGWSDGKGLGKHEDGISQALKPKLKRSVTGIGHDAAAEFNEHWWSALYDKAAKNVEVEEKNGKTKKIKTVDSEDFTITNSTWRINKKRKNNKDDNEYSEYFIRKAVLTNDGTKVENVTDSEDDDDDKEKKDVFKMTDEELFAACEGRTAHKGARHGLKAIGKLARIAQQEQILLTQTKYQGYSHAQKIKQKDEETIEDTSITDTQEEKPKSKKKKKRKRCFSNENCDVNMLDSNQVTSSEDLISKNDIEDTIEIKEDNDTRKSKKSIKELVDDEMITDSNESSKKAKKNKRQFTESTEAESMEINSEDVDSANVTQKKKKKMRKMQD